MSNTNQNINSQNSNELVGDLQLIEALAQKAESLERQASKETERDASFYNAQKYWSLAFDLCLTSNQPLKTVLQYRERQLAGMATALGINKCKEYSVYWEVFSIVTHAKLKLADEIKIQALSDLCDLGWREYERFKGSQYYEEREAHLFIFERLLIQNFSIVDADVETRGKHKNWAWEQPGSRRSLLAMATAIVEDGETRKPAENEVERVLLGEIAKLNPQTPDAAFDQAKIFLTLGIFYASRYPKDPKDKKETNIKSMQSLNSALGLVDKFWSQDSRIPRIKWERLKANILLRLGAVYLNMPETYPTSKAQDCLFQAQRLFAQLLTLSGSSSDEYASYEKALDEIERLIPELKKTRRKI
jgi:hypothetical protein